MNGAAQPLQIGRNVRGLQVGAGNPVTQVQQQFGDAAHADAANADKMNMIFFQIHGSLSHQLIAVVHDGSGRIGFAQHFGP